MAERNEFVLFLFTLMTNKKTFLQTATLIEDILGVKKVRQSGLETVYVTFNPKSSFIRATRWMSYFPGVAISSTFKDEKKQKKGHDTETSSFLS